MTHEASPSNLPPESVPLGNAPLRSENRNGRAALLDDIAVVRFSAPLVEGDSSVQAYVSPQIENLLGYTQSEWLSDPLMWLRRLHPEDRGRWDFEMSRTGANGLFRSDFRFLDRDDRIVWLHHEARLIQDCDRWPLAFEGVAFDITELKQTEESLRASRDELKRSHDKLLDASEANHALLANINHELRSPLNTIIGYCEIIEEDAVLAGHPQYVPDLKRIQSSGRHLLNLINDVICRSKVDADTIDLFVEGFSVQELIDEALATVEPLFAKHRNRVRLDISEFPGMMRGDKSRVRQVLFHLLSNASKVTEQGTITIGVRRFADTGNEWMEFSIADTGVGFAPDMVAALSEDFSQTSDKSRRKLSGLGLEICRRLCQAMDGSIRVSSELGRGSKFVVRIPTTLATRAQQFVAHRPNEDRLVPDDREVVLSIDDDPATLDLMSRYLAREGFRVVTATTGKEGLQLARELKPIAITLDVMMPEMDGWRVLTELKGDRELAQIPVIIVTVAGEQSLGYALGASAILSKPVDPRQLVSLVLARHRLEMELHERERRFQKYFELGLVGMALCSVQKTWIEFNDTLCHMFGYSRQDFAKTSWVELTHPDELDANLTLFGRMMRGEQEDFSGEKRFIRADGSCLFTLVSSKLVRHSDGSVSHFIALLHDISHYRRVEDELREREQELIHLGRLNTLGELVAVIAHEVNQPLYAISNYASGCKRSLAVDIATVESGLDSILRASHRAADIIAHYREFAGRNRRKPEQIAVERLIANALEIIGFEMRKHGCRVSQELACGATIVTVDAVQIEQAIINLLRNACDSMVDTPPPRRIVHVGAERVGDEVRISIADAGCGITEQDNERISQPFFTTKEAGTGLGLRITKSIVELHGGTLRWTSVPGQGAVFHLSIPTHGRSSTDPDVPAHDHGVARHE